MATVNASSGSCTLEPVEGGTRLTMSGETEVGGFGRLLWPLMGGMARRNLATGLAKVKRVLEAQRQQVGSIGHRKLSTA